MKKLKTYSVHLTRGRVQNIVEAVVRRAQESEFTIEELVEVGWKTAQELYIRYKFSHREKRLEIRRLYEEGHSTVETSDIVGTSRNTVKKRVSDLPPNKHKKRYLKGYVNKGINNKRISSAKVTGSNNTL